MKKSKKNCSGCYNEEYHHGLGGSKECWSYKDATIVQMVRIDINQMPPFDTKRAEPTMSCYRRPQYSFVKPENLTKDGYWK